ncbi:ubiquitin-2 like/Rad60 SUMO-like protein [Encephalitozoon intestinalis ATCC 50506]|uniref:Ubiquitin-2 like/Rad60 SUMO-like protein n=1 Tax=Encephalitozoon intestinalis (strain ATCC 50506) TaxID=876142 RepID=W8P989_ENCIT|nr:ubiquitin-2 like/Rad60 SUMO-like protein [Encephalitozoon intestinalis ATCC 50506]AHL30107.1 ubiquitin-2 like/Rad60 SUMO-like protein [Encephalitozoon intestinalis ATCC 50506]UTX45321.1 ubiquitin-like protein [Encephalitozoon intestinalis]
MHLIRLRCTDRMSVSVLITIGVDNTIKELKEEICRHIGKDREQITLKRENRELADSIEIDAYELKDGECIEIEYR